MGRRHRSRRFRRVRLIALCAVGLLAVGAAAFAVRRRQLETEALAARERGRAALLAGDYAAAIDGIGRYLQRHADDDATAQDYVLYAKARRQVAMPNGKHLKSAIASLRKALELDPNDEEARSALLDLYLEARYTTEALELIDAMLVSRPDDLRLRRMQRDVFEALHLTSKALACAKRIDEIAPDDVGDRLRTLRLLVASGASAADIDAWADAEVAAHAGNQLFELLPAAAFVQRGDLTKAKPALDRVLAAVTETTDQRFRLLLVGQLDASGRTADSVRVLESVPTVDGVEIGRELARRLWYAGRCADLASRADLRDAEAVRADPEVVAIRALALMALGRADEAAPLRDRLSSLTDNTGRAWATLATWSLDAHRDAAAGVADLADAVQAVPQSALLHKALGDAYALLGETDLALESWTVAAKWGPGWSSPLRQIADALLALGRVQLAAPMARAAMSVDPDDAANVSTYLRATAALAGRTDPEHVESVLKAMAAFRTSAPDRDDDTLPTSVVLLARIDGDTARRRLQEALDTPTPASEATLLRLARVAHDVDAAIETKFLDRSETTHGVTAKLALARADALRRTAGADAGLRLYDSERSRAGRAGQDLDWDLARCGYLESAAVPGCGAAWIALADARPDSLVVQLGAIASPSAWRDREGVARVIERVRGLTCAQSVTWRVARARFILGDPSATEEQVTEAAKMLGFVVRAAPRNAAARLLLADAFEKLRNPSGADEQLRFASEIAPDDMWIPLEVARLAQEQGRRDAAARQLDRVVAAKELAPEQTERAAFLLAMQGDRGRSVDLLEPLAAQSRAGRDGVLLLVKLYAGLGKLDRATALVDRLMTDPDPTVVEVAADVYARAGRMDDAESAMSRLDSMDLAAGDRELARARHAASWAAEPSARDWYRRAVAAAPARADAWDAYVSHSVALGDVESVSAALDDPRAAGVDSVRFLAGLRDVCGADLRDVRLRALLVAALNDKADRAVLTQAIRAMPAVGDAPGQRAAGIRAVRELADANARVLALQLVAADLCAEIGEIRRGCEMARRAMTEHPNSAAAAREAAELSARAGRWDDAADAGIAWRDRGGRRDLRSESFVADALTRSGRPAEGAAAMAPFAAAALARPDENADVLMTYAVALLRSGQAEAVKELLSTLADRSPAWRTLPLRIDWGRLADSEEASAWMQACAASVPADGASQVRLARAWGGAWERFRAPEFLKRANEILAAVGSMPAPPAEADAVAGTLAQESGDLESARVRFEAALRRDPGLVGARNNLAMVLADGGRWQEAVTQADAAALSAPNCAAVYDTLAYALSTGRQFAKATESIRKAILLEPANPAWHVRLAETLAESGEIAEIARVVARVDDLSSQGVSVPPTVRERLDRIRTKAR